jgi:hypothetical protein
VRSTLQIGYNRRMLMRKLRWVLAVAAIMLSGMALLQPAALARGKGGKGKAVRDCTCKGHKLYGRVEVVSAFPDLKVQVVDALPDLKVQMVDAFPTKCGMWQMVDRFPDLKIQFVSAFPDIKIKYVTAFPGLRR